MVCKIGENNRSKVDEGKRCILIEGGRNKNNKENNKEKKKERRRKEKKGEERRFNIPQYQDDI